MPPDIIERIEDTLEEMTGAQRKVAEYILDNSIEAALSTIDQIARGATVSTGSVIRLANAVGFDTFSEFQRALKDYLRDNASPINRWSVNAHENAGADGDDPASEAYRFALENLAAGFQNLSSVDLTAIAGRLCRAERIYICGYGTCESVARYLTFNLNRMFLNAFFVGEGPSLQMDMRKRIGPRDALVAITVSRYSRTVVDAAEFCAERGIDVIAVTDSGHAPFSPRCVGRLTAPCRSNAFHNSQVSLMFLCDVLIKYCADADGERVRRNLELDEDYVKKTGYYYKK